MDLGPVIFPPQNIQRILAQHFQELCYVYCRHFSVLCFSSHLNSAETHAKHETSSILLKKNVSHLNLPFDVNTHMYVQYVQRK